MLVRRRGIGTQVVHPKVRRPVELSSLYDDLAKSGQEPRTEVRVCEVRSAPDHVAEALGLPAGLEVTWIERLRFAGGEPLAIMHNAVPADLLRLTTADLESHGLYELLRAAGTCRGWRTRWSGPRPPPRPRRACSATRAGRRC